MTAEPMTTEDLAEIRADYDGVDEYDSVPRLLAEIDRLHTWAGLMSLLDEHWPEDLYPTREDDAVLGSPGRDLGPRIVSLLRWVNTWRGVNDGNCRKLDEANAEVDRLRDENAALRASLDQLNSFPDNPGPGDWSTSYRMGYADAGRDVRAIARVLGLDAASEAAASVRIDDGPVGTHSAGDGCGHAPEMPRPPAESHGDGLPAEKRPEGRMGVPETLSGGQVSDSHWLKFNADRQVTGCECGFRADIDSDCGWGDSVVNHLLDVGHIAQADALKAAIRKEHQKPGWVAYEAPCDNCKTTSGEGRADER